MFFYLFSVISFVFRYFRKQTSCFLTMSGNSIHNLCSSIYFLNIFLAFWLVALIVTRIFPRRNLSTLFLRQLFARGKLNTNSVTNRDSFCHSSLSYFIPFDDFILNKSYLGEYNRIWNKKSSHSSFNIRCQWWL